MATTDIQDTPSTKRRQRFVDAIRNLGRPPQDERVARQRWAILARRRWLILQAVVLVPAIAFGYSAAQKRIYRATAQVQLRTTTAADAEAEARAAKAPAFLASLVSAAGPHFARDASVDVARTNLLDFSVKSGDGAQATRLATLWAYRFSLRRRAQLQGSLRTQIKQLKQALPSNLRRSRIAALRAEIADPAQSPAIVVAAAKRYEQVTPRPVRALLVGLLLGALLGVALALVAETTGSRRRDFDPRPG